MQFLYFDSLLCFFVSFMKTKNSTYYNCSRLLCVNIEIKITSNSPFNSNFNLLNVIFMFKEMSWFVKNAFITVYPCLSKIWTIAKLKLLITWQANTDCVDQSPLQRAVLYTHLQKVNYRWFKMFIWFETNEEKNKLRYNWF